MNMTAQKQFEYIVLGTSVRIIIPARNQTLKVTAAQIQNQLSKPDIDPKRRKMYEGALKALQSK